MIHFCTYLFYHFIEHKIFLELLLMYILLLLLLRVHSMFLVVSPLLSLVFIHIPILILSYPLLFFSLFRLLFCSVWYEEEVKIQDGYNTTMKVIRKHRNKNNKKPTTPSPIDICGAIEQRLASQSARHSQPAC